MIHNLNNFVNESSGSSLNFSAHGWWGKEKNLSAEKSVRPKVLGAKPKQAGKKEGGWGEGIFARLLLSGGMAEGGFGGNSAMPERIQKEAAPAACSVRSRSQQKSFLFLLEEKISRAQIKKCKENFFAGWRALASGGGANQPFRSKKVRANFIISPQIEISSFESVAPRGRKAAALRKIPRRFAANWLAGQKSKTADLLRTRGFVPIFWTNDFISCRLSDFAKKLACFISKIHSRKGSTQLFLQRSKSFICSFKAARERMRTSFRFRYISFGTSPSKYAESSFSMRSSFALIPSERF